MRTFTSYRATSVVFLALQRLITLHSFQGSITRQVMRDRLRARRLRQRIRRIIISDHLSTINFRRVTFKRLATARLTRVTILILVFSGERQIKRNACTRDHFHRFSITPVYRFDVSKGSNVHSSHYKANFPLITFTSRYPIHRHYHRITTKRAQRNSASQINSSNVRRVRRRQHCHHAQFHRRMFTFRLTTRRTTITTQRFSVSFSQVDTQDANCDHGRTIYVVERFLTIRVSNQAFHQISDQWSSVNLMLTTTRSSLTFQGRLYHSLIRAVITRISTTRRIKRRFAFNVTSVTLRFHRRNGDHHRQRVLRRDLFPDTNVSANLIEQHYQRTNFSSTHLNQIFRRLTRRYPMFFSTLTRFLTFTQGKERRRTKDHFRIILVVSVVSVNVLAVNGLHSARFRVLRMVMRTIKDLLRLYPLFMPFACFFKVYLVVDLRFLYGSLVANQNVVSEDARTTFRRFRAIRCLQQRIRYRRNSRRRVRRISRLLAKQVKVVYCSYRVQLLR